MSKANLVSWIPEASAEYAEQTAKKYGYNISPRVALLLETIGGLSNEASEVANSLAYNRSQILPRNVALLAATKTVTADEAKSKAKYAALMHANRKLKNNEVLGMEPWQGALLAEMSADAINQDAYNILASPIVVGRTVDRLRNRPRYADTPFLDVVRRIAELGAISTPRDVIAAGRLSREPEDIRDIALAFISDGAPVEEALKTAKMV